MFIRRGILSAALLVAVGFGGVAGVTGFNRVLAAGDAGPNTSCTSANPCATDTNAGSGPGLASTSAKGTGLTGSTALKGTALKNAAGVLGTDASASGGFNAGIKGVSNAGTGALGTSKSGSGVQGTSTSGNGVLGSSSSGTGIYGTGVYGVTGVGSIGVTAITTGFGPALSVSDNNGADLIHAANGGTYEFTVDGSGNVSAAKSLNAPQVQAGQLFAESSLGAIVGTTDSVLNYAAVDAQTSVSPAFLFAAFNAHSQGVFDVNDSGNMVISGQLFTAGVCSSGCITHGPGAKRVVSYAPRESQPTMEDFGTGSLAGGHAHVALDPAFANVISRDASYLVFLTPEGDCKGLYVAHKTVSGFEVAELQGGTSSVAFDYRIVAKPLGDHSARLPMIEMPTAPRHPRIRRF